MSSETPVIVRPDNQHLPDWHRLRVPLQVLTTAQTKDALRNILGQYPDMLSSWADDVLTQMVQAAWQRQQMENLCIFSACRAFLTRCRSDGIENALAKQVSLPLPASSPMAKLLRCPKDDASALCRIALCRQALGHIRRETEQELWATLQYELANCLAWSQEQDRAQKLEDAIQRYQAVLDVWTHDNAPEMWAQVLHDLGSAFRFRVHGDRQKNLKRAIKLYNLALQVRTRKAHPDAWAETQMCLGIATKDLPAGNRKKNQECALRHYQAALEVWSRHVNPVGWARLQHNLGNACAQFIGGERVKNLERALKHYRLALRIRTRDTHPVARAMTQVAMANTYVERIRGDRAENLERAIALYEQALEVRTRATRPAEWAETQYDLAVAHRKRVRGDRARNQEDAIKHYELALEVHTRQAFPVQWAIAKTDLGLVYYRRLRGERTENLERAINLFKEALEVRQRDTLPEQWATTQLCLANAHCDRLLGQRAENIELAIKHYNLALKVRTLKAFPFEWAMIQNNLGTAYWERVKGQRAENCRQSIQLFNKALEIHTPGAFPVDARRAARNLGNLLFGEGRWTEAHGAYTIALQAADNLYAAAFMDAGREAEIGENAALYAHDAFCLAHLGQFKEALMRLEAGKTRTLTERLGRDAVQLQKARDEDQRAYREKVNRLKGLEAEQRAEDDSRSPAGARRPYTEIARDVEQGRQELEDLTQRIRGYLPDFLPSPLDFAAIQALVPDEHTALVEFCVTEKGSVILIVRQEGEPKVAWVEGFTQFDLRRLLLETPPRVQSWLERYRPGEDSSEAWKTALSEIAASQGQYRAGWQVAYQLWQVTPKDHPARESAGLAWLATIERVLAEIGLGLIAPLHAELQQHNPTCLTLIPQGSLFLLPLHAVPIGQNGACLLDHYEVSYAPSATVFQRCQERAVHAQSQGLFAVADPTHDLDYTESEIRAIEPLFGKHGTILWHGDATKENALAHLEVLDARSVEHGNATQEKTPARARGYGYVHFSCHGQYNWDTPSRSALLLAGSLVKNEAGKSIIDYEHALTLTEVEARLDLAQTRLVTLSACETGLSEALGPRAEEYVGLPAGFLLAGAPAVVASLWTVDDFSTALLMKHFYLCHLHGDHNKPDEGPLPPASALRRAQQWLRDVTARELAAHYDEEMQKPSYLSFAQALALEMRFNRQKDPDGCPFSHPIFWAPFTISGQ